MKKCSWHFEEMCIDSKQLKVKVEVYVLFLKVHSANSTLFKCQPLQVKDVHSVQS